MTKPPWMDEPEDKPDLVQTSIRIERDLLEWLKSLGPNYQRRLNRILRFVKDEYERQAKEGQGKRQ